MIVARTAVLGTAVFAVSGGAVVLLGVWLVGRPLHQLADKARRVGDGDLSRPLQMARRDELGELADVMNEMCSHLAESQERLRQEQQKRIETLEQLRHADRLRTVGRLAAGVAHELGTPLNTISMRSTMILQDCDVGSVCQRNASIIQAQTERLSKIVRQLLAYARPRSLEKSAIDLQAMLKQTLEFLKPLAANSGADLWLDHGTRSAITWVDADQIQQVMTNLIVNGVQAMPTGGTLSVEVRREHAEPPAGQQAKPGDYFRISVRDEGEGIPARNLKHIFDPFFTTKDVGEGSGLGLSIALGIVQEHGGWIDVRSQPGKGSCFSVYLPVAVDCEARENADSAIEME
jgi:signal transduction histidine kinase